MRVCFVMLFINSVCGFINEQWRKKLVSTKSHATMTFQNIPKSPSSYTPKAVPFLMNCYDHINSSAIVCICVYCILYVHRVCVRVLLCTSWNKQPFHHTTHPTNNLFHHANRSRVSKSRLFTSPTSKLTAPLLCAAAPTVLTAASTVTLFLFLFYIFIDLSSSFTLDQRLLCFSFLLSPNYLL